MSSHFAKIGAFVRKAEEIFIATVELSSSL